MFKYKYKSTDHSKACMDVCWYKTMFWLNNILSLTSKAISAIKPCKKRWRISLKRLCLSLYPSLSLSLFFKAFVLEIFVQLICTSVINTHQMNFIFYSSCYEILIIFNLSTFKHQIINFKFNLLVFKQQLRETIILVYKSIIIIIKN